ncbi:MAG: hypothetical protein Kow0068_19680 [Marinilabiliales bacterium]
MLITLFNENVGFLININPNMKTNVNVEENEADSNRNNTKRGNK